MAKERRLIDQREAEALAVTVEAVRAHLECDGGRFVSVGPWWRCRPCGVHVIRRNPPPWAEFEERIHLVDD